MNRQPPRTVVRATLAVLYGVSALARAQSSDENTGASFQLEEVVVTAQRRTEIAQNVPGSLSVLSATAMSDRNIQSLSEFATYVPGLIATSNVAGQNAVALRGITLGPGNTGAATVGTYLDDVSLTPGHGVATQAPELATFDLERIEVLRGPQGTLYGASAMGGLIKYVTVPPDLTSFEGRAEVGLGATDHGGLDYDGRALINIPLVQDELALRMSGSYRSRTGYIDNVGTGDSEVGTLEVWGGKLSALWKPTDRLAVQFTGIFQQTDAQGNPAVDINPSTLQPVTGDLEQSRLLNESNDIEYQLYALSLNANLDWADIVSVSSYAKNTTHSVLDNTYLFAPLFRSIAPTVLGRPLDGPLGVKYNVRSELERFTQELRISSPRNRTFEWQIGAFFTDEDNNRPQTIGAFEPGQPPLPFFDVAQQVTFPETFKEYSGFGDVDIYFTDEFDVMLGARWSHNEISFNQIGRGYLSNPTNPTALNVRSAISEADVWTYSVTPRWRPTQNLSLYATAASGYRPGGPNPMPPGIVIAEIPSTYESDTLWNYEIGLKSQLLQQLALNVSVFYIDWSDIQLTTVSNGVSFIGNGGKAFSKGAELELYYAPFDGLTLIWNGAYTKAELSSDAPGIGGRTGDPLPTVPKWSTALTVDYSRPLTGRWEATTGVSFRYVDERNSSFSTSPVNPMVRIPSYEVVDLRAGLRNGTWGLTLFLNNVFDERGWTHVTTDFASRGGPAYAFIIPPRSAGIQFTAQF